MGEALADGIGDGAAKGQEWRTAPLRGLRQATRFLHDGRAKTLTDAIQAHGGEAEGALSRFKALSHDAKTTLLTFLSTL